VYGRSPEGVNNTRGAAAAARRCHDVSCWPRDRSVGFLAPPAINSAAGSPGDPPSLLREGPAMTHRSRAASCRGQRCPPRAPC